MFGGDNNQTKWPSYAPCTQVIKESRLRAGRSGASCACPDHAAAFEVNKLLLSQTLPLSSHKLSQPVARHFSPSLPLSAPFHASSPLEPLPPLLHVLLPTSVRDPRPLRLLPSLSRTRQPQRQALLPAWQHQATLPPPAVAVRFALDRAGPLRATLGAEGPFQAGSAKSLRLQDEELVLEPRVDLRGRASTARLRRRGRWRLGLGYGDELIGSWAQVEKFELGIDRHLTSAQCDAVFPGLYLCVRAFKRVEKRGR